MLKRELPDELAAVRTIALYAQGEKVEGELVDHPAVHIIRGNELYRAGDYQGAYSLYKEAYAQNPKLVEARVNMGFALIRMGKDDAARDIFENLPPEQKGKYVLNELGNIYARRGDYEQAEEYYKKALAKDSQFSLARLNLAVLELSRGAPDAAYSILREIKEIETEYKHYFFKVAALAEYQMGRVEDAYAHIKNYIDANPEDHVAWLLKAECGGALGKTMDAENSAKKSYELKPTVSAQIAIAAFKLENGDIDGALSIADKLVAKNVREPRLFRTLARGHYLKGNYSQAYEYATAALELRDMLTIRMIRAESARRMGRFDEAYEEAERVLQEHPDYRNAKILKALAAANLGRYDEALELLDSAGGDDFLLHTAYAEVYAVMGDKRKCADSLESALRHKESVEHLRKLCILLYELGEYERMEEYIRRLSDIESKDAYVWFLRGEVEFARAPEEAEKYYLMAVEIDPKFLEAYMKLAAIAVMKNDAEKVKEYMARMAELGGTAELWKKIFEIMLEHGYFSEVVGYVDTAVENTGEGRLGIYKVRALIELKMYEAAEARAVELVKKYPELKEARLYLGIAEYYNRKYSLAMKQFEKLVNVYELDANYYIARILFDTGRAAEALELAEKYGYDVRFMFLKMEILFALKNYDRLLEYVDECVPTLRGKELTRALLFRLRAYFEKGERERGYEAGKEILARDPDNVDTHLLMAEELYRDARYEESERHSKKALELSESPRALLVHARALHMLGRNEEAIEEIQKLIAVEEREEYLVLGAETLFAMGKYEDAIAMAERALEQNKNSVPALVILGKAHFAQEEYAAAARNFERVFFKDVNNIDALYHLPLCYAKLGDYEKSEKMFERAYEKAKEELSNRPEFVETYAEVLYQLEKYAKVVELLSEYPAPTDAMRLLMGKADYAIHEYDEAEQALEEVQDEKYLGEKIFYLTQTLIAKKEFEKAESLLSQFKDERGELLYFHGLVLFNLERFDEALDKFKRYVEEGGARDDVNYYLGVCLFHAGRYEECLPYIEKGEKTDEKSYMYEALAHYHLSHYELAERFFDICVKKELMSGEMWYYYGETLEHLGKDGFKAYQHAWDAGYQEPRVAFRLLKKYMDMGDVNNAAKFAEPAAPAGPEACLLGAKAYMELKEPERAYSLLEGVDSPEANILKGKLLVQLARYEDAERMLKNNAQDPESAYELVKLLLSRGKYEDAKQYFEVAEKFAPLTYEKMLVGYHTGDWEDTLLNAELLIERGEKVGEASYMAGVAQFNLGRYDEAVKYLQNATGEERERYLGLAYYRLGDYERAVEHLSREDEHSFELGVSLYNLGEYERARAVFESIDTQESRVYAGLCAYHLGDYQAAAAALEGAESHREELAESYFMLERYEDVINIAPKNHRILGLSYYRVGELEKAIAELEAVDKKSAEDHFYLSIAYLKVGNYDAAERNIARARELGYEGDLSEFEGVIAYMKGDYARAVALLGAARDPENRRLYGIALYRVGKFGEAAKVLADYDDEESRRFYAHSLVGVGTEQALDKARAIFEALGNMKEAARCALKLGEYEKVLYYLRDADDEESLSLKFEAHLSLGDDEKAASLYSRLPESSKAEHARDMCRIMLALKRYKDAEEIMNTYFYEDYDWLVLRAKIYVATGNGEGAITALRRAKKLNPHDPEISRLLAPLLLNAGHEGEALKEAKKAVKDFPEDAVCWYNLGLAYHRTGNSKKAIDALQKSVKLDPNMAEAWHLLGLIYLDAGKYEDAYSALSHVKSMIRDRDVLVSLAMTAYQLEKYDEALDYIDKAIEMKKEYMALYYRALILVELEREEEAMALLREVIEMEPGFVEARKLLGSLMGGE